MRSPITCCFSSPLKPLMLRLIMEISCSSSNTSSFLLSLWYRRFAASLVGVAPVFESYTLPRFCCVVVAPVFELLSPPRFFCGFAAPVFELLSSPRFCCGGILMSAFFSSFFTVADRSFLSSFLRYVAFAGVPLFMLLEPNYRCSCSGA
jgi:hypothetical protein